MVTGVTEPTLLRLGEAVRGLLESGDAEAFAEAVSVSSEDWNAVLPKLGGATFEHPLGEDPERDLRRRKRSVTESGRRLVEIAERIGFGKRHTQVRVKSVNGRSGGSILHDLGRGESVSIKVLQDVRIFLTLAATEPGAAPVDAVVRVGDVVGFPTGWRTQAGVRWEGLSTGTLDAPARQELELASKVGEDWRDRRTLSLADDEQLGKLGDALVALLRERSVGKFATTVTMSREEMRAWDIAHDWATAEESEEMFRKISRDVVASAQSVVGTLERLGIELGDAQIALKEVRADRPKFGPWSYGSSNGMRAGPIRFIFTIQSPRKSATGVPVAGNYTIETGSAPMRKDGRWVLLDDHLRWKDLPMALMTKAERERIEFENHVIEKGSLPAGSQAPDIEWVRLDTGAKERLSSYRGRAIVLEWWASWCGPCQEPMSELQKKVEAHPEWKDRVAVLAISIDDQKEIAAAHLAKRQWTKTSNVWTGAGGFDSAAARGFRVRGVPTLYIIDRAGKIVAADHPAGMAVEEFVRKALRD
ncbi:MAG: TlpA disulfide reductase family protein [Opitutaceae bacterium]